MPTAEELHECDLFLLTSHTPYAASRILPEFARRGCRNIDGWGLGYYVGRESRIVRRATPAFSEDQVSGEFRAAAEVVSSATILGHLRLRSSRTTRRVENNHPFHLDFLGYQWLLVHNGTAQRRDLVPADRHRIRNADNDTPRVFEFLREQILEYCDDSHPQHSLIVACRTAFRKLLEADPGGTFNIILSNGHLTFVWIHHRPFYRLRRSKDNGDVTLISTLELGDPESWDRVPNTEDQAKMLVFNGPLLVFNGDIRTRPNRSP